MSARAGRRRSLRGPLLVLVLFCTVGIVSTFVIVNTLTDPVRGTPRHYSAEFTSAEGLGAGDQVTVAGVHVGTVDSVVRADGPDGTARAVVGFSVNTGVRLDSGVAASIRYGDMLGVRYLSLTAPLEPSGRALHAGERIPLERTADPIDLTAIFNGFKPLFEALDPGQVNSLARSIVDAFGGEAGSIRTLLTRVADVTEDLDGHREAISRVVTGLGSLAGTMDERGPELIELIDGLDRLGGTLADRNAELIGLLDHGAATARDSTEILQGRVETLSDIVRRMRSMTGSWVDNTDEFDRTMGLLPEFAHKVNSIGDYGGWLELYICNLTAKAGDAEVNLLGTTHSEACR